MQTVQGVGIGTVRGRGKGSRVPPAMPEADLKFWTNFFFLNLHLLLLAIQPSRRGRGGDSRLGFSSGVCLGVWI